MNPLTLPRRQRSAAFGGGPELGLPSFGLPRYDLPGYDLLSHGAAGYGSSRYGRPRIGGLKIGLRGNRCRRACAGLALLEALIAAALLATSAAGLIRLQAQLAWAGEEVRHQGEALWLAQQALEQGRDSLQVTPTRWTGRTATFDLQGEATDTTPDGLPATSAPTPMPIPTPTSSPAPALTDPFPLRALSVHVSWTDRRGHPQRLDLHTLVPSANRSLTAWLTRADS